MSFTSLDYLPRILHDPIQGRSYSETSTAFQTALGTSKPIYEWLGEKITVADLKTGAKNTSVGTSLYPMAWGTDLQVAIQG